MCQARAYSLCFFKTSDGLYFIPLFLIIFNSNWSINSLREAAVDIVLDVLENSHDNVCSMKFSVKLQPTNMEFVNPSRLKFSPDFPQKSFPEVIYKSSCSALMLGWNI